MRSTARSSRVPPHQPNSFQHDLEGLRTPAGLQFAAELGGLLERAGFGTIDQLIRSDARIAPHPHLWKAFVSDFDKSRSRLGLKVATLYEFFKLGRAVPLSDLCTALGPHSDALIQQGKELGVVSVAAGKAGLSGLMIVSYPVSKHLFAYGFADLPAVTQPQGQRRVYVGSDSWSMILALLKREPIGGPVVEMCAGNAIQTMALLKAQPSIPLAVAVETDDRCLSVAIANAAMNGLSTRFAVTKDSSTIREAVNGRPLALVYGNPPNFAGPESIGLLRGRTVRVADLISGAGYGGTDGWSVSRSVVSPLIPQLSANGSVMIFQGFDGDKDAPRILKGYSAIDGLKPMSFTPWFPRSLAGPENIRQHVEVALTVSALSTGQGLSLPPEDTNTILLELMAHNRRLCAEGYFHTGIGEFRRADVACSAPELRESLIQGHDVDLLPPTTYRRGPLLAQGLPE